MLIRDSQNVKMSDDYNKMYSMPENIVGMGEIASELVLLSLKCIQEMQHNAFLLCKMFK